MGSNNSHVVNGYPLVTLEQVIGAEATQIQPVLRPRHQEFFLSQSIDDVGFDLQDAENEIDRLMGILVVLLPLAQQYVASIDRNQMYQEDEALFVEHVQFAIAAAEQGKSIEEIKESVGYDA